MKHHISQRGNFVILHLKEDVTTANAHLLDSLLDSKILTHRKGIILDLAGVGFMDSSGATVLARAYKVLKERDAMMILVGCNPFLKKLFQAIGFDKLFRIADTIDDLY